METYFINPVAIQFKLASTLGVSDLSSIRDSA